jgi:hypothetical protein
MQDLLDKIALIVPSLEGWCPVDKAQWMATWIVNQRASKIVEIGVFGGRSLIPMGMAVKFLMEHRQPYHGKVVGLDSYNKIDSTEGESDLANRDWWAQINLDKVRAGAELAIVSLGLAHIVDLRVISSTQGVSSFEDGSVDLVHVDGQHAESVSCRDVDLWFPKLRSGGIMVMDDTDWHQLQPARKIIGAIAKCVHHDEKWEVYQKP